MAITATNKFLDALGALGAATTATSSTSITPAANKLLLATWNVYSGSVTTDPTMSGGGVTWVLVSRVMQSASSGRMLAVFRAMGAGSSGALTLTRGGSDTFNVTAVSVDEIDGVKTTGANGADALGGSASDNALDGNADSVSLTPASGNGLWGTFANYGGLLTSTPGTGLTELSDGGNGGNNSITTLYRASGGTVVDVTLSGGGVVSGLALELVAAGGTAAVTGTLTPGVAQEIRDGGKTIILTLTGDTFVASGSTFDAQRQAIINGLTAASSPTNGWNSRVRDVLGVSNVVRTSNTVCTITIPATSNYAITSAETITATIPAAALTGASAIVATPTISILVGDTHTQAVGTTNGSGVPSTSEMTFKSDNPGTADGLPWTKRWVRFTRTAGGVVLDSKPIVTVEP